MKTLDPDWPVFEISDDEDSESQYSIIYENLAENGGPKTDRAGREYTMVGQFLENNDFYQGLNMITVIKRVSDGKLFGYSWWDDISKHGQSYIEHNGDEFGVGCDTDAEGFDWRTDYVSYYVFEPVEASVITSYIKTKS